MGIGYNLHFFYYLHACLLTYFYEILNISHMFSLSRFRTVQAIPIIKTGGDGVDMRFRNSWAQEIPIKVCVMFFYGFGWE